MWGMQPGISKLHLSLRMVEVYDLECKLSMQYVLERHKTGSKTGLSTILMSGKKIIESGRKNMEIGEEQAWCFCHPSCWTLQRSPLSPYLELHSPMCNSRKSVVTVKNHSSAIIRIRVAYIIWYIILKAEMQSFQMNMGFGGCFGERNCPKRPLKMRYEMDFYLF